VVSVQTANAVDPKDARDSVAMSLSGIDPPRTAGVDQDVPLFVLSEINACQGLVLSVPVFSYHKTNAVLPETATFTGHELSLPAIPIADGVLHVFPELVDTVTYSWEVADPGNVLYATYSVFPEIPVIGAQASGIVDDSRTFFEKEVPELVLVTAYT